MTSALRRIDQNQRRSRAIVAADAVYLAGQVADTKAAGVIAQAREALAKVDALLAEAGTDKAHVLTAQIWLASTDDYEAFNAVWDEWVIPGQTPTRSCAIVTLVDPAFRVEITVTAALP